MEYRIKELNGKFTIQTKYFVESGYLWWKKIEEVWTSTTEHGDPVVLNETSIYWYLEIKYSPVFKNIEDAKKQIEIWNEKPKFHYL